MFPSFPSTHRRRIAAALAVCLLAIGGAASFASADDLKDKQKEVKKQLHSANADLEESSAALRAATIELREAQAALGSAQAKLAETRGQLLAAQIRDRKMQARLVAAVQALADARQELLLGQKEVQRQRTAIGELVADLYEMGDPEMLGFASLLEADDPGDMTRSVATNESMVDQETATLDNLRAAEVLLAVKESNVEQQKDLVEVKRREAAENLKLMESLEKQAEEEEASVRALVGQRAQALKAASRAKAHDRVILVHLKAEENRITNLLKARAAAAAAKHGGGHALASGGFLNYPVSGHITSPFGYRIHPIYGYYSLHNGVDFGASCGAPLYAAASGRVIAQYYQTAWGNRLVIDHGWQRGVSLATIYNHATHYVVGEGQRVTRGQVVGYVGSTGWSTGCHLHFTVMVNGTAVDPMNWF